mgnify:CR=1 FL=1|tara:strand:- start:81 stop:218 length:138 start_codon:yes stop_codon:yes gene_type:complete
MIPEEQEKEFRLSAPATYGLDDSDSDSIGELSTVEDMFYSELNNV